MKIKKKKEIKIEESVIEKPIIREEKTESKAVKEEPVFYVVSVGDSISDIAKKFDTTEEEIIKLNGTKDIIGGNQIMVK